MTTTKTHKFTKSDADRLAMYMEVMDENGCVTADNWTTGRGSYTKSRALPCFVEKYTREAYEATNRPAHGTPARAAYEFFERNPRRKTVLVLDRAKLMDVAFAAMRGLEIDA
ncbi:MAG: hypothetical protein Q4B30_06820 [Coriobacteriaceae bacterium]|nr:hypothetical protein [Coriobacteriaceae bacterium]